MIRRAFSVSLLTLTLTASTAFAGGQGTLYHGKMTGAACTSDADCAHFKQLPQVTNAWCRGETECAIRWGECLDFPDYAGVWNPKIGACEFHPVIPQQHFCASDADCGAGGGVQQFGNVKVTSTATCAILNPENKNTPVGTCVGIVSDAQCCAWGEDSWGNCDPQPTYCFSNADCYPSQKGCFDNTCQPASFSQVLDDGNVCIDDLDCVNSTWGPLCVTTLMKSSTGSLCQECQQIDSDADGVDDGCTQERPRCNWGLSWKDSESAEVRSYNQCEVD